MIDDNMDRETKIDFSKRLLTKYFLYGYLCLLGCGVVAIVAVLMFTKLPSPYKFSAFSLTVPFLVSFAQFCRIAASTPWKFKYYKISLYRLKTRGYKDSYFECEMHEPCFRLMIKDILYSHGYKEEYLLLQKNCCGRNIRIERAKEKLIAQVKRKHEKATSVV